MKTSIFVLLMMLLVKANAQDKHPSAAVLKVNTFSLEENRETITLMIQLEMEKTRKFNVLDPYEVNSMLHTSAVNPDSCFGLSCAVEAGRLLNVDKIVTGRFEKLGDKIAITLKLVDVRSAQVEHTVSEEFLNIDNALEKMTEITVARLAGMKVKNSNENLLIYYDQPIKNPHTESNLSGPRFGAYYTTGDAGKLLRMPKEEGGFGMSHVATSFGWQSEKQYLSSGHFNALIEVVMLVSGMESGRFIPSLTLLNGFRMSPGGWEVAFGPVARVINMSDGHVNSNGTPGVSTAFVLAGGKTFHSGYLNLPVNIYTIPGKHGWVCGMSMGFNIYKKK